MEFEADLDKQEIVIVYWIDSSTQDGWDSVKAIKVDDDKDVLSVGFLLGKSKDFVIISGDIDPHEKTQNRLMQIPIVAIKSIYKVNKGRRHGILKQKK